MPATEMEQAILQQTEKAALPAEDDLPIVLAMLRVQIERYEQRLRIANARCDDAIVQADVYAQRAAAAEGKALQLHSVIDMLKNELADAQANRKTFAIDERSSHRPVR